MTKDVTMCKCDSCGKTMYSEPGGIGPDFPIGWGTVIQATAGGRKRVTLCDTCLEPWRSVWRDTP